MKIIDCFIFNTDLELLKYRFTLLNEVVDYFVIVEANYTYSGKEKPFIFNENKDMFKEFNHKIIHIMVDKYPFERRSFERPTKNEQDWVNGMVKCFVINHIRIGIRQLENKKTITDNDIIIIAELDEIPNPHTLTHIKNGNIYVSINHLDMDIYYYNLNSKVDTNWKWPGCKILTFNNFKKDRVCTLLRHSSKTMKIHNGGWYLWHFDINEYNRTKREYFVYEDEEQNKQEYVLLENIQHRAVGNDFGINDNAYKILKIKVLDNPNLPPEYDVHLTKFYSD